MNTAALLPAVAAVVALASSVLRRLPPLLVSSSIGPSSPQAIAWYAAGGRLLLFLLAYGLLFGVAFGVGRRRADTQGDSRLALASGLAAAVAALVGTGVVLSVLDPRQGIVVFVQGFGSALSVGVQFAVIAFAGLASARYRSGAVTAA